VNLPSAFVIKETICALLELLCNGLGLLVPLEPCLVLLVEAPALAFERLGRQVLLVCALLVVEGVEQAVSVNSTVQSGIVEDAQRLLGVVRRSVGVGRLWLVMIGLLGVHRYRAIHARCVEHVEIDRVGHRTLLRLLE
jgi:hypothetical protein